MYFFISFSQFFEYDSHFTKRMPIGFSEFQFIILPKKSEISLKTRIRN